jgi:hypothetical protein
MSEMVSKTTFLVGLITVTLLSVFISTVVTMQYARGPRGEQGPIGPQGPPGPSVIPFASTNISHAETTSSSWVDIPGLSVTITLNQTSNLVIMLSMEAYNSEITAAIMVRVLVGTIIASPGEVALRSIDYSFRGFELAFVSYSYNFFYKGASPGTYTIKVQWLVTPGSTGTAGTSTLIVIALPSI